MVILLASCIFTGNEVENIRIYTNNLVCIWLNYTLETEILHRNIFFL